jgi:hypothetical protein
MKKTVFLSAFLCLISFSSVLCASVPSVVAQEINSLNSLDVSSELLNKSGGRCWQTCADNDYAKLNCVTTCDDDNPYGKPSGYFLPIALCIAGGLGGTFVPPNGWWEYGCAGLGAGLLAMLLFSH